MIELYHKLYVIVNCLVFVLYSSRGCCRSCPGKEYFRCCYFRCCIHYMSMHRFPRGPILRKQWLKALKINESGVKDHHCACSMHFANGDVSNTPDLTTDRHFASPKKAWTSRAKRAKVHEGATRYLSPPTSHCLSTSASPSVWSTITAVEEPINVDPDCGLACTDGNIS